MNSKIIYKMLVHAARFSKWEIKTGKFIEIKTIEELKKLLNS